MLHNGNPYEKVNAAIELGNIGDPQSVEFIIDVLKNEDPNIKSLAVYVLWRIGDSQAFRPLVDLLFDSDFQVGGCAARALRKIMSIGLILNLTNNLNKEVYGTRRSTEDFLRKLQEVTFDYLEIKNMQFGYNTIFQSESAPEIVKKQYTYEVESLIGLLGNENPLVRWIAIFRLWEIQNINAVKPLIQILNDVNKNVRWIAINALGDINDSSSIDQLIALLKDEDEDFQICATYTLGKFNDTRVIDTLVDLLNGKNHINYVAARALGELKAKCAVEPLIEFLMDGDFYFEYEIIDSLRRITGQDFSGDPMKWKEWWKKK